MRFTSLLEGAGVRPVAQSGDSGLSWITADSRDCKPGSFFVCMPSERTDSHRFIKSAMDSGAVACLAHSKEGYEKAVSLGLAAAWIKSDQPDFNRAVGDLARTLFDDPSSKMRVVGVTGTNGKTTTAWMLRDALRSLGRKAAYLGTLGIDFNGQLTELSNTTPFPIETWQILYEAEQAGVQDFIMEVSSHALFERRVAGVRFEVGLFTNLSQDHLDFHPSMEEYEEAKKLLFTEFAVAAGDEFRSAINIGDYIGLKWADQLGTTVSFGAPEADLQCRALEISVDSLLLLVSFVEVEREFRVGVGGTFNVWNVSTALAALLSMGYTLDQSIEALEEITPVPGRFEVVANDQGIGVIVDYAHTDDALRKLISSARELNPKRVITVFGCGGDRDKNKRPKMALAASENSDITIVTSDNPRTEDPERIMDDIEQGLVEGKSAERITDRVAAIRRAIEIAEVGDVVVIAGKGHEDYQMIGHTKHPMDDRQIARDALGVTR